MKQLSKTETTKRLKIFRIIGDIFGLAMVVVIGFACFYLYLSWDARNDYYKQGYYMGAFVGFGFQIFLVSLMVILLCVYVIYLRDIEKPRTLKHLGGATVVGLFYFLVELVVLMLSVNGFDSLSPVFFVVIFASVPLMIGYIIFHFIAINKRVK